MAIDAAAQLALMTKARLVFESSGRFLSFPALALSPLTYTQEQLTFTTDGNLTAQDLAQLSEFARVTNVMPSGPIAPLVSTDMLWDVLRDVLDTAERADGTMTATEQVQYDSALAYLYAPAAPGSVLRSDSADLRAYRQCRDALFTAQEAYAAAKQTATSISDPAVTAQWETIDEPRLRAHVDASETAWATTGHRDPIEAAIQIELAIGARSPARLWTKWQTAYLQVIDQTTDTSGLSFATTGFVPSDAFRGTWPPFTLNSAEISTLCAQASPEMSLVLGPGSETSDVESISFEFRSVGLLRPWFEPAMFEATFWRLGPAGGELSDGETPPVGHCPSYVAGLVFARNIVVKRHAQPPTRPDGQHWRELMMLDAAQISRIQTAWPSARIRDHRTPAVGDTVDWERQDGTEVLVHDHRLAAALKGQVFTSSAGTATAVAGPSQVVTPPEMTSEPEGQPSSDITILAYICHRMPRCPNPDPGLHWPLDPPHPVGSPPESSEGAPVERGHLVVAGDTLSQLAKNYYGDSARWPQIAERNHVSDPAQLKIGQYLIIP